MSSPERMLLSNDYSERVELGTLFSCESRGPCDTRNKKGLPKWRVFLFCAAREGAVGPTKIAKIAGAWRGPFDRAPRLLSNDYSEVSMRGTFSSLRVTRSLRHSAGGACPRGGLFCLSRD